MPRLSLKIVLSSLGVAILIAGFFIAIYLVQKQTTIRSKAYDNSPSQPDSGGSLGNSSTEIGFQIDTSTTEAIKIPMDQSYYDFLKPQWVRLVYRQDKGVPTNIPSKVKILLVFNNESVGEKFPVGVTDVTTWITYIDNKYIPALQDVLRKKVRVNAFEIWNEQDIPDSCTPHTEYCPKVPAEAYSYMLKKAAFVIKQYNPNLLVISGGLNKGEPSYIQDVLSADKNTFERVDGVGFHPYGKSPDGWCVSESSSCAAGLPFGDLGSALDEFITTTGKPIWITEIGQGTDDKQWQGKYLVAVLSMFIKKHIPVVIWYGWHDLLKGEDGKQNWGLVNLNNAIKPSGVEFATYSTEIVK